MFIDLVEVEVIAGAGGDGRVSWRREKFIDRGGPTGGDGGDGGSIVFQATANDRSLSQFRYRKMVRAESGQAGRPGHQHGRRGTDRVISVPVGTVVSLVGDGRVLADLVAPGQRLVVAQGGIGGFGNAHFKSSRRRAPKVAERGTPGQRRRLRCELKLLADIGLVGQPNAGKSTLLRAVTAARPKVADYPFTTLEPHLGVAEFDQTSLLLADIPGLIAGASEGKGLGHQFLRHLERNRLILHLIDCHQPDPPASYRQIRRELDNYSRRLGRIPEVVAVTKIDSQTEAATRAVASQLRPLLPKATPLVMISSWQKQGLKDLLRLLNRQLEQLQPSPESISTQPVVIGLDPDPQSWRVSRLGDGNYLVLGAKIERFAAKTRFESLAGRQRLRDIVSKMGIKRELIRQGYQNQEIVFGQPEVGRLSLVETEGQGL